MKMNPLGRSGPMVSELCLGTMTWGTRTPQADAHRQIDMALDAGVNFIDNAEMYPVNPVAAETVGLSEQVLGEWLATSKRRGDVIVATKHSGEGMVHARGGAPISSETIPQAVEQSLKRLRVDCIDLYQFHWPNRGSYSFRENWNYDPSGIDGAAVRADMRDALGALDREVEKGNIRHFGLSNETAWGMSQWLDLASDGAGPRPVSVQNEYSLLCRLYDTDMAELCTAEEVGMLPYSPLAGGLLTGKYQGGRVPEGSRRASTPDLGGRVTERVESAVAAYLEIADRFGLDPVQMALAFAARRPGVASGIFGAGDTDQAARALGAADIVLSDEVVEAIDKAHRARPMPF